MWILIFLFFFSVLTLGWVLFGYYIWLFLLSILRKKTPALTDLKEYPPISLIVTLYNEEDFIQRKIENIKNLDYPEDKLQVILVDANSSDKTKEKAEEMKAPNMELINASIPGKINQLNLGLKHARGEIIFVSDADGLMSRNSIKEALKEFNRSSDIYVTGIYSYPKSSYNIDRYYWLAQNKGRILETQAFTSSIVVAVCYSFRKKLLDEFPHDVIADDIYISYLANSLNYRVAYIDRCHAEELRGPRNLKDFLSHKYRKSNAFLRESLRFLYRAQEMNPIWRVIFLTKIAQMVLSPWLFAFYIILGGSLISLGRWDVFMLGSLFLMILLIVARKFFTLVRSRRKEHFPFSVMIRSFLLSIFILFAAGVSFVFFKQDSRYRKIDT